MVSCGNRDVNHFPISLTRQTRPIVFLKFTWSSSHPRIIENVCLCLVNQYLQLQKASGDTGFSHKIIALLKSVFIIVYPS